MKRTVIYRTLSIYVPRDGTPMVTYYEGHKADLTESIKKAVEESRLMKAEIFIHFLGLSRLYTSVANILSDMGYDMTVPKRTKKSMRVKDCRYRITDKTCFYLQVKTGYRSYITFQCMESVIGETNMPNSEQDMKDMVELYNYTRKEFLKGIKRSETRILYSSSTISRTLFGRKNRYFAICEAKFIRNKKANSRIEKFIRPCIHGGINFVSDLGKKYTGDGVVLDCNSLYPDQSVNAPKLPDIYFETMGIGDIPKRYTIYPPGWYIFRKVKVSAVLKPDGIACIQSDGRKSIFTGRYLKRMQKEVLTLSEADYQMLLENYDIKKIKICAYCIFSTSQNNFTQYINDIYNKKRTSTGIKRQYYKMLLNGLIGTFAKKIYTNRVSFVQDDKTGLLMPIKKQLSEEEQEKQLEKCSGLVFLNAAIVSAARLKMVRLIKKCGDRFLYTDTDSIHLSGKEIPDFIKISDDLGDFKIEHTFEKCLYKDIKNYVIVENGKILITIAGIPKDTFQRLYERGKIKGVDYEYIEKALQRKDLTKLYEKPVPVHHIEEDAALKTLSYTTTPIMVNNAERIEHKLERRRNRTSMAKEYAYLVNRVDKKKEQDAILRKLIIGYKL